MSKTDFLEHLFAQIEERKSGDMTSSYTAQLLAGGVPKCARKFGEEATETIIAALEEDGGKIGAGLVNEAADTIYHLLVLLAAGNYSWAQVRAELQRREGVSGLTEKASRNK